MFNSRNSLNRSPTGAVADGTDVHFKISVPRDLHCSSATLLIINEKQKASEKYSMFWCGMDDGSWEFWECDFVPKTPGLYFYQFQVESWKGTLTLSRTVGGEASFAKGSLWQITVYDQNFKTPDWLAGGVMYQIFPDRFFCSGQKKKNVPQDRKIHTDWREMPDWEPNEQGVITNSDYFGGDLKGITQKLDYLKSLGVTCIYINPIFESHSNHRYNTADYSKIDPLLGEEHDFRELCSKAAKMGIHVMLDGVFSHTGSDSIYFNREGRYASLGAYNSQESPYYPWYTFQKWPDKYECWWNFITLPNVTETGPQYNEYINGKDGIVQKWLGDGADAWRLDVADELPDEFIENLRAAAKAKNPDAIVLGEVWEDASNKSAYGRRRNYLLGAQLDSVMNYPFREAILGFLTGLNPADMMEIILSVLENYPPQVIRLLMNHIGTHDTERALTMLGGEPLEKRDRLWQSTHRLTSEQRELALKRLRLAALMQFTLPGVPCIYYGDEAGMEGYRDPFNRACYPWGDEDLDLIRWYRSLSKMRSSCSALKEGEFLPLFAGNSCMAYIRRDEKEMLLTAVNAGSKPAVLSVPSEWKEAQIVFGTLPTDEGLKLEPYQCAALTLKSSC